MDNNRLYKLRKLSTPEKGEEKVEQKQGEQRWRDDYEAGF